MDYMNGYTAISMLMKGETERVANENDPPHVWYTWLEDVQSLVLNKILDNGEIEKELALPFIINQMDKWYHHSGYLPCPICGGRDIEEYLSTDDNIAIATGTCLTCIECSTLVSKSLWNKRYKWKR
jgi:hypothetical protein